jgi:hypothetical protein
MRLKPAEEFCKSRICPSAETLLAFHCAELIFAEMRSISSHLARCEFCSAELHLLTSFPQAEANYNQTAEMPFALRQLAEALLGGKQTEFRLLENLLYGDEQLTLKNA